MASHEGGERWRKVAQYATRAECVNLIRGKGEWWLAEIRAESLANTLFADNDESNAVAADRPA